MISVETNKVPELRVGISNEITNKAYELYRTWSEKVLSEQAFADETWFLIHERVVKALTYILAAKIPAHMASSKELGFYLGSNTPRLASAVTISNVLRDPDVMAIELGFEYDDERWKFNAEMFGEPSLTSSVSNIQGQSLELFFSRFLDVMEHSAKFADIFKVMTNLRTVEDEAAYLLVLAALYGQTDERTSYMRIGDFERDGIQLSIMHLAPEGCFDLIRQVNLLPAII